MSLDREYTIFCDESEKHGRYYSNFYGGLIVSHRDYEAVTARLEAKKLELNFYGEVKWAKVSAPPYLEKYQELISAFFDEVRAGNVRVRIMFRQNAQQATGLSTQQADDAYFLLYYQFLKHAFGLLHLPSKEPEERPTKLRLYFDKFPETHEKIQNFRGYLLGLPANAALREAQIIIKPEDIAEVDSHDHVLLQCLDIVMGAMAFRLNEKHKEKLADTQRRGRKTRAKEKLYKTIHAEICTLRPRFNIGVSTGGASAELLRHWSDPYRHWNFKPKNAVVDSELFKAKRKKPPE